MKQINSWKPKPKSTLYSGPLFDEMNAWLHYAQTSKAAYYLHRFSLPQRFLADLYRYHLKSGENGIGGDNKEGPRFHHTISSKWQRLSWTSIYMNALRKTLRPWNWLRSLTFLNPVSLGICWNNLILIAQTRVVLQKLPDADLSLGEELSP